MRKLFDNSQCSEGDKVWFMSALLMYLSIGLVALLTLGDYGMSWDEIFRFGGGDSKLKYYKGLMDGEQVQPPKDSYPGLFDLPLAWADKVFPDFGTRSEKGHALSLFFGLVGLLSAWRLTARIGGERAGFWALLLLAATPRYYGHMFFNPKDIPLAATYTLGLWALVAAFQRIKSMPWWAVVFIGMAAGISMSARIAGFLILCYFGLFVLIYLLWVYAKEFKAGGGIKLAALWRDLRFWFLRGLTTGAISLLPLMIFWPALHVNPFGNVEQSLGTVQSYGWDGKVLMDGYFWDALDLPFYYIPYWMLKTLPETVLALLVIGVGLSLLAASRAIRNHILPEPEVMLPRVLLIFSAAFPLAYMLYLQPTLYDGARHFLFVVPALVCIAALSLEWGCRLLSRSGKLLWVLIAQCAVGLGCVLVASDMRSLHPYEYIYFNRLSGGLAAAYMRDETDYWGLSHKEAAEWLNEYVDELDPEGERVFKVHQRYSRWMLKEALNPNRFEMTPDPIGADFFVSVTRFNLHTSYPDAKLLHVVQRQGVPLCYVFQLP